MNCEKERYGILSETRFELHLMLFCEILVVS